MATFGQYSHYYDLLYKDKDYRSEVNYVNKLIKKYSSKKIKTILDLGCGTGNHDILLAQKDYQVHGIDISKGMLFHANLKKKQSPKIIQDRLEFTYGDTRKLNLNKKFDFVSALFHTISYHNSNKDLSNFFKTIHNHLKKNRLAIFDFWYGPAVLSDKPVDCKKEYEGKGIKLTRYTKPKLRPNRNLVDINYKLIIHDKLNKKEKIIKEKHQMRYFFIPELLMFLDNAGFKLIDTLKWMSLNEDLDCNTWYGIMIIQKK